MKLSKVYLVSVLTFTAALAQADTLTDAEREELEVKAMKYDLIRSNPKLVTIGEKILEALRKKECGIKETQDFWRNDLVTDDAEYGAITLAMLAMMTSYEDTEFPFYFTTMQNTASCQGGEEWYKRFRAATEQRTKENNERLKSKAGDLNPHAKSPKQQISNSYETII